MTRFFYVNGQYHRFPHAAVSIFDRGYQFADGIYEVVPCLKGALVDSNLHLNRLERSLAALKIDMPLPRSCLTIVIDEMVRRNKIQDGLVYCQITRGVAMRDHPFPAKQTRPSLVITTKSFDLQALDAFARKGVSVITTPDTRWARCDIKSISLLPNVLSKQEARENAAFEAWLTKGDRVIEGASSNAWILTPDNILRTHPLTQEILGGITRTRVLDIARHLNIRVEERAFTLDDALSAQEAFMTSATSFATPIIQINQKMIGNGQAGKMTLMIRDYLMNYPRGMWDK